MRLWMCMLIFTVPSLPVAAQEQFMGIMEYKTTFAGANKQPATLTGIFGKNKVMFTSTFTEKGEILLFNCINDSIYYAYREDMTYNRRPIDDSEMPVTRVEKTDSFKTILDQRCRGYIIFTKYPPSTKMYVWICETLRGFPGYYKKNEFYLAMMGAPYVIFAAETYNNGKDAGSYMATSMKREIVPDSVFDLTGFTENLTEKFEMAIPAEEAVPEIPPADTAIAARPAKKLFPKTAKKPAAKKNRLKTKPAAKKPGQIMKIAGFFKR